MAPLLLDSVTALWVFRHVGWLAFFSALPAASGVTDLKLGDLVFVWMGSPL